jgi:hypothetical protein
LRPQLSKDSRVFEGQAESCAAQAAAKVLAVSKANTVLVHLVALIPRELIVAEHCRALEIDSTLLQRPEHDAGDRAVVQVFRMRDHDRDGIFPRGRVFRRAGEKKRNQQAAGARDQARIIGTPEARELDRGTDVRS